MALHEKSFLVNIVLILAVVKTFANDTIVNRVYSSCGKIRLLKSYQNPLVSTFE